jgi:hypothetical protein
LYPSSNIIGASKSRRKRWAGQATRMGGKRNAHKNLSRKTWRKATAWEIKGSKGGKY